MLTQIVEKILVFTHKRHILRKLRCLHKTFFEVSLQFLQRMYVFMAP